MAFVWIANGFGIVLALFSHCIADLLLFCVCFAYFSNGFRMCSNAFGFCLVIVFYSHCFSFGFGLVFVLSCVGPVLVWV